MLAARRNRLIHRGCLALAVIPLLAATVLVVRDVRDPGDFTGSTGGLVPALVSALIGLLLLVVAVMRPEEGGVGRLGRTSNVAPVVLTTGLLCLWYIAGTEVRDEPTLGTPVIDRAEVDSAIAPYLAGIDATTMARRYEIPTGVFLQSVEFLDSNNVEVSGYVWQRYAADFPAEVERGFVLPETIEDAYTA